MIDALSRFAAKTKPGPSGCLDWTGCTQPNGYGKLRHKQKTHLAHRSHVA